MTQITFLNCFYYLLQISYSSSAAILSDKRRFPAFMRTIPSDEFQTAAMAELLRSYGWNWVGMVTTDGDYGRSALDNFVSHASEKGICVAFRAILPQSVTSEDVNSAITDTASIILKNPKVKAIVSFAKPTHMVSLFQELKSQTLREEQNIESMRRVWVASDSWSFSSSVSDTLTLNEIGHVIGFSFKNGDLTSLHDYLSKLEATGYDYEQKNPFLQKFFSNMNSSKGSGGGELTFQAVKTLRENIQSDIVLSVEMAVSAITQAVTSTCQSRNCKTPGGVQPWEVITCMCFISVA